MAATVESAFILVDRASGPIRGIRRELRELEIDARRTGRALDDVSGPRQAKQLDQLARETRVLGQDTHGAANEMDNAERSARRFEQRASGMARETKKAKLELSALGKIIGLLKWPALIAGIGGATQALGGLTAGAIALLPKLMQLGGAAASGGVLMAGLGSAMGVVKLATADLSKALSGNKNALKGLTPEGRAFVQILKSMHPEIQRLRSTAQRGLFPGLGDLLGAVKSQAPQIRGIVGQTARDLGGLARFFGKQISGGNFMGDLRTLSDEGARALGAAARSGFYFGHALEHVLIAAGPFTDWLGNAIERLAKMTDRQAQAGRESGRLGAFFDRTRRSIIRLADVGKHTFEGLKGLLHAATGQGDSLWKSIDQAATRWDKWSNSVAGQTSMRRWFDDMRPALSATVGLVGDLAKAIGSLTQGPEGAQMLNALRDAMPSITTGIRSLTSTLGPAVIDAFGSFVHLLGDASGQAGPLTLLARSVGYLARAADALVGALGPVGPALATAFLTFRLLKKMNVFGALDVMRAKWMAVTASASEAAVAERAAMLGGAGGVGGGGVPLIVPGAGGGVAASEAEMLAGGVAGGLAARGLAGRAGGLLRAGETATAGGVILPAGVEGAAAASGGAGLLARASGTLGALRGGGAMGLLSKGAGVVGKFALPLMALQGVLGFMGTKGNFGQKLQGAGSSLSFGLIPRPISEEEKRTKGGQWAQNALAHIGTGSSLKAQRRSIGQLRTSVGMLRGNDAFDQNTSDFKTANDILRAELKRRQQILTESLRAQQLALREQSVRHGQALSEDFAKAFEIRAKTEGPLSAMDKTVHGVLEKMRMMNPAGAKVIDQNMLSWARQQARKNPALLGEVHKLEDGIKDSFSRVHKHVTIVNGQILTGTTSEWKNIRVQLTTQTEIARQDAGDDFTAIQLQAIGSLTAMGFSASDARSLVSSMQQGGRKGEVASGLANAGLTPSQAKATGSSPLKIPSNKKARGGRVSGYRLPGAGTLEDVVPMVDGGWGAPGELVVNRHTESDHDRDARRFGLPTLDERIRREHRKHSDPLDQSVRPQSGILAGFARGGRVYATGERIGRQGAVGGVPARPGGAGAANLAALINEANRMSNLNSTYQYGGGHVTPAPGMPPWDCSSSWSRILQVSGVNIPTETSGMFASQFAPGPGLVTLYANQGHVYGSIGGHFWGTSTSRPHGGPGWFSGGPRPGFAVRHIPAFEGQGGALGAIGGPVHGGGASVAAAMHMAALHSPNSRVGGLPGAAANRAGSLYAAGLTKKINAHLATMGGAGNFAGVPGGGGTSGANQKLGKAMMLADGWPGSEWPPLKALWTRESGWNQNAVNPSSGAQGIPQALGHGNIGSDPRSQIAWGLNYIKGRYGSPSAAWAHEQSAGWYDKGGRIGWGGWNGDGGRFTVDRPTIFGAGERGREHVTITPAGSGGHGDVTINVHRHGVHVDGAGADAGRIERIVTRKLEEFADAVHAEIVGGREVSEEAVL